MYVCTVYLLVCNGYSFISTAGVSPQWVRSTSYLIGSDIRLFVSRSNIITTSTIITSVIGFYYEILSSNSELGFVPG